MRTGLFDIEADGLRATRVHCMSIIIAETGENLQYRPGEIDAGVRELERCDRIVAHNGIAYDVPTLIRLHNLNIPRRKVYDSLVMSRMFCGNLTEVDFDAVRAYPDDPRTIPKKLIGRHGIEAWGRRLGMHKGDYAAEMKARGLDPWARFNEMMMEYCVGDTQVLYELWTQILAPRLGEKVYSFPVKMTFLCRDKRDESTILPAFQVTVPYTLPADAYERADPVFPLSDLVTNLAKKSPSYDPNAGKQQQITIHNIPGFVEVGCDKKYIKRNVSIEPVKAAGANKVEMGASYYTRKLASTGAPKDVRVYRGTGNNGDTYQEAARSIAFRPTSFSVPQYALDLEHDITWELERLRDSGILLDVRSANELALDLTYRRDQIVKSLSAKIADRHVIKIGNKVVMDTDQLETKRLFKNLLKASGTRHKTTTVAFNVGSRKQVGELILSWGYKAKEDEKTPTGLIKCADEILARVEEHFAETDPDKTAIIKDIRKFYLIQKRLGMLSVGAQAWLKCADRQGLIHPTIATCAAVTSRAAHSNPNMSQVPAILKVDIPNSDKKRVAWGEEGEWGADCRKLFIVPPGFVQLGVDLSGIELRMLAHYLYPYDHGRFANAILTTDPHEDNQKIIGFANRTDAKRFIFALIYGAGDEKLGHIIDPSASPALKKALGLQFRHKIASNFLGYSDLLTAIAQEARSGYITAIDGRRLPVRAAHAALNTLLQSGGAIVAKEWMIQVMRELDRRGFVYGYDADYTFLLWSHDELQFAVRAGLEDTFKQIVLDAAVTAGEKLNTRIPIAAEAKVGMNWFDTH